jgi:hypothetical protein
MDTRSRDDDLFYDQLICSYVKAQHFVKRPDLISQVEEKLREESCRFLLITGEPGTGKAAFRGLAGPNSCRQHNRLPPLHRSLDGG